MIIRHSKWIISLITIFVITIIFYSCSKEKDQSPSILGFWILDHEDDSTTVVQLSLYSNGFMEWIPLEPTLAHQRHSAEFTYRNGILKIVKDFDCPEPGVYKVALQGNTLSISLEEDDCQHRISKLQGNWIHKNLIVDMQVQAIWRKSIMLNDTLRDIYFHPLQTGSFEWAISKETPQYYNSLGRYAVGPNHLVIFNFLDCPGLAYYNFEIQNGTTLILSDDYEPCPFRATALSGTWQLQNYH